MRATFIQGYEVGLLSLLPVFIIMFLKVVRELIAILLAITTMHSNQIQQPLPGHDEHVHLSIEHFIIIIMCDTLYHTEK